MTKPLLSDYLTPAQAAGELNICTKTLERWAVDGKGPPRTKLGRRIMYRRATVAAWIAAQEQRPRTASAA